MTPSVVFIFSLRTRLPRAGPAVAEADRGTGPGRKRRARQVGIVGGQLSHPLDALRLRHPALDLALPNHATTLPGQIKLVQFYLWVMGRPSVRISASPTKIEN